MVHQRGEHVDRDPGVGVPLGVGVPVGVRDDARLVEFGAVGAQQRRQAGDPVTVPGAEVPFGDRPAAVRVGVCGGQQLQLAQRGARERLTHPGLLIDDQAGSGLGDREPPSLAGGLVVEVDQHRFVPGLVVFQAVPRQRADLVRPAAGVDDQLGRDPGLAARHVLERGQVAA